MGADIDWQQIAHDHILTGGAITNVLRYCAIKAMQREAKKVMLRDVEAGIRKELIKEGDSFK